MVVFCGWLGGSALVLYQSNKTESKTTPPVKAEVVVKAPIKEVTPYSTVVKENGKDYRQFYFPDKVSFGSLATIKYRSYGSNHGREIFSALDVERDNVHATQGTVNYPLDEKISFLPNQIVAVDPSHLNRFRPNEVTDISMKQTHDVDVDVYLEACTQMKGLTRLDLSASDSLTTEGIPVMDEYLALKQLDLWVSVRTVLFIAKSPALQKVSSLGLYSKVDLAQVLARVSQSQNLKALKVQTPALGIMALQYISQMPQVEELALASQIFKDAKQSEMALNKLSKMKRLRILSIDLLPGATGNIDFLREKIQRAFPRLTILRLSGKTYFFSDKRS